MVTPNRTFVLVATVLAILLSGAFSLSTQPSRRGFFEKAAAGISVGAFGIVAEPTDAATLGGIYEPEPHSLAGKVILITGGSSGLGLESAKRLAAAGATTVLTTRTDSKGAKALAEVQSYLEERSIDNPQVFFLTLNLDDLDSVRSFPQQFIAKFGKDTKIDVLMNNAGVAAIPKRELTKDGFERTFQSNHLGGARIINVASLAHKYAGASKVGKGLDLDNLNGQVEYLGDGWRSYCQTKLENVLFTQELQRRADERQMDWLSVSSLHPGAVATDIWRTSVVRKGGSNPLQSMVSRLSYSSMLSTEEGANTQIWLAAQSDPSIGRGQYYDERGKIPTLDDFAKDPIAAKKLWEQSEEMLGIRFQL